MIKILLMLLAAALIILSLFITSGDDASSIFTKKSNLFMVNKSRGTDKTLNSVFILLAVVFVALLIAERML